MILETPKQLAARVGLKERAIRSLIDAGKLEYIMIGSRVHIPDGAFERFVEANKVSPCLDGIKALSCIGAKPVEPITSSGLSMAAAAGTRQALQTANRLKQSSRNGFGSDANQLAQVIQIKS